MENAKHTNYGEALNEVCKQYYSYQQKGFTEIVINCADGKRFDFSNKPLWAKQLEKRGIKVDPMVWARVIKCEVPPMAAQIVYSRGSLTDKQLMELTK